MTKTGTRKASRSTRKKLRSPGRPPILAKGARRPFWTAIARGMTSEDAARVAGISPPVGTRWFRQFGGMPLSHLTSSARAAAPSSLGPGEGLHRVPRAAPTAARTALYTPSCRRSTESLATVTYALADAPTPDEQHDHELQVSTGFVCP
jgi:hypothetical protein